MATTREGTVAPTAESDARSVEREARVRGAYDAYSHQDVDRLLTFVTEDVDWPDGERRLRGKPAVRAYWTAQWSRTRTRDVPTVIAWLSDHVCAVRIDQEVRDTDGAIISSGGFAHVLHLDGPLISRLDIVRIERAALPNPQSPDERRS